MSKINKIIQIITLLFLGGCLLFTYYHTYQKPEFSVIIPTYNRAHLLPHIFKSIDESTFKNFEVIFVNDASNDNTEQVLKEYAKKQKNITILRNSYNLGMEGARNRGIEIAKGDYIGFMDDDDIFYKDWIEKSTNFFKKNPKVDAVVPLRHHLQNPLVSQNNRFLVKILKGNVMGIGGAVITKDFLHKYHIRFKKEFYGAEDYAFWHDVLKNGGIIRRVPHFLVAIRSGVIHSDEHYQNAERTNKFISNSLKKHFSSDGNTEDLCAIYKNILNTEKYAQQFEIDEIEEQIHKNCGTERVKRNIKWTFSHPKWTDGIILLDNNVIQRDEIPTDKATIIQMIGNEITVQWHNYGIETFICDKNRICNLKKTSPQNQ